MPADPPLSLSEAERRGFDRARSTKCGRRGDYAIGRLRQHFGDDAKMIVIREALSARLRATQDDRVEFPRGARRAV
jgi:hypothetical protein